MSSPAEANPVEVVADYGDLCGESPLWDARNDVLYWTDITGRRFYRYSPTEQRHKILLEGFEIAGLALVEPDGFITVNSNGVWIWNQGTQPKLLAETAEGQRCALNDCIADPEGRLFAGSTFFDPSRENYPLGCLFRVDTDGSVHIVEDGIRLSNGLGFSPDETLLYYVDSASRRIYEYDYERRDGSIRNRRVLIDVPREQGIPDGLTVDAEGFIWSAYWFGGCVRRYRPDGTLERVVPIPAAQTSSLNFGGADLTDIYITSAAQPDALSLAPAHFQPEAQYVGGKLFRVNLGIRGKQEYRARIYLAS